MMIMKIYKWKYIHNGAQQWWLTLFCNKSTKQTTTIMSLYKILYTLNIQKVKYDIMKTKRENPLEVQTL